MGRRGVAFLWRKRRITSATFLRSISAKLSTNTCPAGGSRHMVSHSRKVSIKVKGSNLPKNPLLRVPYLWPAYGSRETFCDAYAVSIPWWTSYRFILPRLLRDVPFSSYPRPNVFLCHGISNGETWMPIFFKHTRQGAPRSDRRFALVNYSSAHFLVDPVTTWPWHHDLQNVNSSSGIEYLRDAALNRPRKGRLSNANDNCEVLQPCLSLVLTNCSEQYWGRKNWIQHITFAAETNAANTHNNETAWAERHNTFAR